MKSKTSQQEMITEVKHVVARHLKFPELECFGGREGPSHGLGYNLVDVRNMAPGDLGVGSTPLPVGLGARLWERAKPRRWGYSAGVVHI